jgi:cathepsin F
LDYFLHCNTTMKVIIALAVLFAVALAIPVKPLSSEDELKAQFAEFTLKYNKVYATAEEFDLRFANFKASVARTSALQAASPSAQFGITKFSDMSEDEFRSTILMKSVPAKDFSAVPVSGVSVADPNAPATFDWRDHNAVTPVKDQGQCGSCWAFSATEAIESAWILKGHATPSSINLSPQQIVDCDSIDGVQGCNGGLTESAYQYIVQAGGQEPLSQYPYTAVNGNCKFNSKYVDAKISTYTSISKDESALPTNLATIGPLSICLDASRWQDYQSGVLTNTQCCPFLKCTMDHCVQLVGYNSTASTPYWIVRNSWNTDWGVDGYIYLEMNKNTCGIANDVTWPTSD